MDNFKNLLNQLSIFLKTQRFIRKGDSFYLFHEDNYGIVNFQKSKDFINNGTKFTINLGVFSNKVFSLINKETIKYPKIEECHWKIRIGFLMPEKKDHWWVLTDEAPSFHRIYEEVFILLRETIVPKLKIQVLDETLKTEWMNDVSSGISELQRYMYLTTLLKLNNDDNLPQVIDKIKSVMKGRSYEFAMIQHLKELNEYGN